MESMAIYSCIIYVKKNTNLIIYPSLFEDTIEPVLVLEPGPKEDLIFIKILDKKSHATVPVAFISLKKHLNYVFQFSCTKN